MCPCHASIYLTLEKEILQICNQFWFVFRCVQVTVAKRSEFSVDVLSHTSHNKLLQTYSVQFCFRKSFIHTSTLSLNGNLFSACFVGICVEARLALITSFLASAALL